MVMETVGEVITDESFSKLLLTYSTRSLVLGGAPSPAAGSLPLRNGNRFRKEKTIHIRVPSAFLPVCS